MNKVPRKTVADILREWRQVEGYTQRRAVQVLKERTGFSISLRQYSRWEGMQSALTDYKFDLILAAISPPEVEE